jgi:hypothetical protein
MSKLDASSRSDDGGRRVAYLLARCANAARLREQRGDA